jgi:hypothetical protein
LNLRRFVEEYRVGFRLDTQDAVGVIMTIEMQMINENVVYATKWYFA